MSSHRAPPIKDKAWQHLSFEERFNASFTKDKITECWNWNKIHPTNGYGGIVLEGKQVVAHRASWIYHNGKIADGLCVLHKCDNRACVNPKHLYLGDRKQNRKDFMERHPRAKELVAIGQKAAAAGAKRFWDNMDGKQRREFCSRRSAAQMQKNGGRGYWHGKTRSAECIIKQSQPMKGKPSQMKNKHHTPKTCKKISAAKMGGKASETTKKKMSLSAKKAWTKRRTE